MTRKRMWLYFAIGQTAFAGTLLAVAPPLAPAAVGFAVVYLTLLAIAYMAGSIITWIWGRGGAVRRTLTVLWAVLGSFLVFTALGAPGWGVAATVLTVIALWPTRRWA